MNTIETITMPVPDADGITLAASRACRMAHTRKANVKFRVTEIEMLATPDSESDDLVSFWLLQWKQREKEKNMFL
jgi:hypothetical protein